MQRVARVRQPQLILVIFGAVELDHYATDGVGSEQENWTMSNPDHLKLVYLFS